MDFLTPIRHESCINATLQLVSYATLMVHYMRLAALHFKPSLARDDWTLWLDRH
jgi:hypothetical protein